MLEDTFLGVTSQSESKHNEFCHVALKQFAGDAHDMNATVLMGWSGVGLHSCSFNLHTRGMGLGLGLGWGG